MRRTRQLADMHMPNARVSAQNQGGGCTTTCDIIARTHQRRNARKRAIVGTGNVQCAGKGEGKRRQGSGGGRLTWYPSRILRRSRCTFRARGHWAPFLVAHFVRLTCRVAKGGTVSVSDARWDQRGMQGWGWAYPGRRFEWCAWEPCTGTMGSVLERGGAHFARFAP